MVLVKAAAMMGVVMVHHGRGRGRCRMHTLGVAIHHKIMLRLLLV